MPPPPEMLHPMPMDASDNTTAGFINTSPRQTAARASGNMPPDARSDKPATMDSGAAPAKKAKLGAVSGVFIPTVLNILSILMFLRFGSILGRIGLLGILGMCNPNRNHPLATRLTGTLQAF